MADNDRAKQRIIASVFEKRSTESYVAHVKIWEDAPDGQGRKPRYIILSRPSSTPSDDAGFIHKSKLNTNGTFSVGKTWRLAELKGIHVVTVRPLTPSLSRPLTPPRSVDRVQHHPCQDIQVADREPSRPGCIPEGHCRSLSFPRRCAPPTRRRGRDVQ